MFRALGITYLLSLGFLGATSAYANDPVIAEELMSVIIIGSTEHPDPFLTRFQDLEKKGILKNVIVMGSFPVQIKVTGPKSIIEELQDMPRKVPPSFK